MSSGVPPLHKAARVYYGVHHPVQYNVNVKEIGYIPGAETHILIRNWQEEDGKEDGMLSPQSSVQTLDTESNASVADERDYIRAGSSFGASNDDPDDGDDNHEDDDNEDDDVAKEADYAQSRWGPQRPCKRNPSREIRV